MFELDEFLITRTTITADEGRVHVQSTCKHVYMTQQCHEREEKPVDLSMCVCLLN